MTDAGIPRILHAIDEALSARQWDRARRLVEGLCVRLAADKAALRVWMERLHHVLISARQPCSDAANMIDEWLAGGDNDA